LLADLTKYIDHKIAAVNFPQPLQARLPLFRPEEVTRCSPSATP
jgi:hypothetical protein